MPRYGKKTQICSKSQLFYYYLTEVTCMTLFSEKGKARIPLSPYWMSRYTTIFLCPFLFQFSQKPPWVSSNALWNFGVTFIMRCFVHTLSGCNAHTKATHHRIWQQCYQQEFGFRIRSDSSYILAAEKQHTAILIPWCYRESKNST